MTRSTNAPKIATLLSMIMLLSLQLAGPGMSRARAVTIPEASAANVAAVLDHFQRHYQATTSFTARFDQTITRPGAPPIRRSGIIYYQKPGRLRWEFEGSQPETIVSDGKTIYDFDPALNQVVETPVTQALRSQAAAAFLLGAGNVKRDFKAEALSDADGLVQLALTPKQGGEQIEAGIERKTYNIVTLSLGDAMGNRTQFKFSSIKLNPPLEASQFAFTPPEGVDIVKAGNH
jgi:outer membrane lipoprotein carrier protein